MRVAEGGVVTIDHRDTNSKHAESVSDACTEETLEFITIPEWCRRVGCSIDTGYRVARRDNIPGLFRIGRLMRVNWSAFVATTDPAQRAPEVEGLSLCGGRPEIEGRPSPRR